MDIAVIKIGGSLFRLPSFRSKLNDWLSLQESKLLLIAGGGEIADDIRRLSARFELSEDASHWLAIRAMSLQTHILAALFPSIPVIHSLDNCKDHWIAGRQVVLFDPIQIAHARDDLGLPRDWTVTSDSLAARFAHRLGGHRLVLLKSVGGAPPLLLRDAISSDWLDPHFPEAAGELDLEWVNLREGKSCPLLRR